MLPLSYMTQELHRGFPTLCVASFAFGCHLQSRLVSQLLKGYPTQKGKFCHQLLTLKLLQTCMSFFLLLNTKEDALKNDWN